jgi:hypothetical protein
MASLSLSFSRVSVISAGKTAKFIIESQRLAVKFE